MDVEGAGSTEIVEQDVEQFLGESEEGEEDIDSKEELTDTIVRLDDFSLCSMGFGG